MKPLYLTFLVSIVVFPAAPVPAQVGLTCTDGLTPRLQCIASRDSSLFEVDYFRILRLDRTPTERHRDHRDILWCGHSSRHGAVGN